MFLRFVHIADWSILTSFLLLESILLGGDLALGLLISDEHFDHFQFAAVVSKSTVNICMLSFCGHLFFIFLGK